MKKAEKTDLTPNQKKVHKFLRLNQTASFQETAEGVGLSKGSVQRAIKSLQKKNLLTRQQPVWVVTKR